MAKRRGVFVWLVAFLLAGTSVPAQEAPVPAVQGPGYVWWEGEQFEAHNFTAPEGSLSVLSDPGLSGGKMITVSSKAAPAGGLCVRWRVSVEEAGSYELWARIGWRGWCSNDWRFDDLPPRTSRADAPMQQLVRSKKWDVVSWVLFGRVNLDRGEHVFEVSFREGQRVLQHFDCFVLSRAPFVPLGRYRPDEEIEPLYLPPEQDRDAPVPTPDPRSGWWPIRPIYRPGEKSRVDLSWMNDPVGSHGFVTMKDGELVFEDGTPVRFWGPNVSYWSGRTVYPSHEGAEEFAEHIARLGVNCVRLHILHSANSLIDASRDDTQQFDPDRLDRLEYLLYALRKRGIYVDLDLMYHRTFKKGDGVGPELVGSGRTEDGRYNYSWAAGSAAFFHPRVIELNRALYRKLLTHTNPYTGLRWVDDPAVAMLTIHNEQSVFWGTTNIHRGRTREILDGLYTAWLKEKYGTQARLAAAWQVEGQPSPFSEGEDLDRGTIHLGRVGTQSQTHMIKRGVDQLRFLYDVETGFYRDTIAAMRTWGVRCPIITSNWRGAGQTTRLVLQASCLGEIVDRHAYFGGRQPMLGAVGRGIIMTAFDQQAGRGFCISEWNSSVDGLYVPETVPLVASVAALQGWDALFQFCASAATWEVYQQGLTITPGHYALYPLAAMIFRRGDIRPGILVYERRRSPGYQFSFQKEQLKVPPEVIAVGRVQNAYVKAPTGDLFRQGLVGRCWDREEGVVRASTGQLEWHYKGLWMRLNSERTQGAFGALAGKTVECDDVTVETTNPFCAILVTAMEKKPIRRAGRLLVAAVGRSQNMGVPGAQDSARGGRPPCLMEPVTGKLSIRTPLGKVYALDAMGYRIGEVAAERDGERLVFRMEGKPQVLYYEVAE